VSDIELVRVEVLGLDLAAWDRARQHYEALFREFALISTGSESDRNSVPRRLLELIDELRARFSGFTAGENERMEDALAQGDATIDLHFELPASAADASRELAAMLDEAEEYCRDGTLLTLVPPVEVREFRDWYLDEFVAQLAGAGPTTFAEWRSRRAD
jgi:hypothetical protein